MKIKYAYETEFATVDLLLESSHETRGVDAFALTLIKVEKQMRKLFTYTVFQYSCFTTNDIDYIRTVLTKNKRLYFVQFINGFNQLYSRSIEDVYGVNYSDHLNVIMEATRYRNKIFHGQLTNKKLSREDLSNYISQMRVWSKKLAINMTNEIGYDGFIRNSFRKSPKNILDSYKINLNNKEDYEFFIKNLSRK